MHAEARKGPPRGDGAGDRGRQRRAAFVGACVLLLALAGCGKSSRPSLVVGAVEDASKWATAPRAPMQMAKEAGLHADVLSSVWHRGADPADDLPPLRRAVDAATAEGVDPILAVWQLSGDTPTTAAERAAFAAYTVALLKALPDVHTVIVDNEPNLNLFWLPQYDAAGGDAAAVAYVRLLAATYDAVKAAEPGTTVIGGALSPHGSDDPGAKRQTHSPTRFLEDMGAAYRASGRTAPLMDELSVHVYGESSRVPPTLEHPNSTSIGIADYAKLVRLVDDAFGGRLPIVYGEYGVETAIPPVHAGAYTGHEVVEPVDEATQARYYRQAIELAACQPRVRMLLFFHVLDEVPLAGLQSGLYYADGAPKESARVVRDTPVTCRR